MKVYCTCGNLQYQVTYYTVTVVLFWTPDDHPDNYIIEFGPLKGHLPYPFVIFLTFVENPVFEETL
jgi:hypothetical protein